MFRVVASPFDTFENDVGIVVVGNGVADEGFFYISSKSLNKYLYQFEIYWRLRYCTPTRNTITITFIHINRRARNLFNVSKIEKIPNKHHNNQNIL